MTQLLRKWLVEEVGSPDAGPSLEQVSHDGPAVAYRCLRIGAEHRCHIPSMQHFANGFWLGEMLSKLNLQPDFDRFEDRRTPDAMLKNFARLQVCGAACHACMSKHFVWDSATALLLPAGHAYGLANAASEAINPKRCPVLQPTFTKLHVPFTSQTAKQLMRGDNGAAAQLLYGIKSAVDRDGGADSVGPNPTKLAATFGFKMPLSRGLLESTGYK